MNVQASMRRMLIEDVWGCLAAGVAGSVLGAYIGRTGSFKPIVLIGSVCAVVVAVAWPRVALVGGLVAMALPYTWGPQVPKLGFGSGIAVGLLLVVAYGSTLPRYRPNTFDIAVLAFAFTPAAIAAFQGLPFHITYWLAPAVIFPYFGFRLLFYASDIGQTFARTIVQIGLVTSLIGIWEGLSGRNPIVKPGVLTYASNGHYVTTWNVAEYRDGRLRALSTFGHPIAFGMVLLIPFAFALARGGLWNLVVAGMILVAEVLTYSRDAWIGCLVVVVLLFGRHQRRILAAAVVLASAAFFVGPVHKLLVESGSASTEAGSTTYYRVGLLRQVFDHMSLFGHPFSDLQSAVPNYPDITSLLAGTIIQTGFVGLLELAFVAGLALVALVDARRYADQDYRAATAALTAQIVGLTSVTLITNYQFFFWALVAYVATLHQRYHYSEIGVTTVLG